MANVLKGDLSVRATEEAVREGLQDLIHDELDLRRGGIRAAITAMQRQATPRVLVVDVSGEERPLSALGELANAVAPDVCVLVVGGIDHVDFYREVTRSMGASEYLAKPLTQNGLKVVAPDLLGRGKSTYFRDPALYTIETYLRCLSILVKK